VSPWAQSSTIRKRRDGWQTDKIVLHNREAVRAVRTRINTIVVVLSESVIWYEYGMHPESVNAPGDGPEEEDDEEVDPFATGGARGTADARKEGKEGFWLVKRKDWKTVYNPDGESNSVFREPSWDC
jgi:hypothetical protein